DAEGRLWMAQWGAGRVAVYDPQGAFLRAVEFDAPQTSCPCFGGADLTTLFVTTARENMAADALTRAPASGKTFMMESGTRGLPAPRVRLSETESED
ncbi:SMP-30/gluconolactonase/LRE family protein, partial [Thioclava sp. BHET1]